MCFLSYLLNVRLGKGAYAVVRNMKDEKVWKMPSCNIHMLEPLLFKLLSAKLGMQLWTQLCNLRYFFPLCTCENILSPRQRFAQPPWAHGGCSPWGRSMRIPGRLLPLPRAAAPVSGHGWRKRRRRGLRRKRKQRRCHGDAETPTPFRSMTQFYSWTGGAERGGGTVCVTW